MSRTTSKLLAALFVSTALSFGLGLEPRATAADVNEPNQCTLDEPTATPVDECGPDQYSCDEICCERGQECCIPAGGAPYCATTC